MDKKLFWSIVATLGCSVLLVTGGYTLHRFNVAALRHRIDSLSSDLQTIDKRLNELYRYVRDTNRDLSDASKRTVEPLPSTVIPYHLRSKYSPKLAQLQDLYEAGELTAQQLIDSRNDVLQEIVNEVSSR